MTQIIEPLNTIVKLITEQKFIQNQSYRKIVYLKESKTEDGYLIFNFLTREMLLLTEDEHAQFSSGRYSVKKLKEDLIKKWFLVPEDYNEFNIANQVKMLLRSMATSAVLPIRHYTILPTTDCNARCFYCFELERTHTHMTAQTAEDVAAFIIKKSQGVRVKINWFGGEPLCNTKAIDIISAILRENNIDFVSSFTSNGYLFNEKNVTKAKELWNMKDVQITLDGTEEIYNRVKAYIYKNGKSPFKVVCDNIERLLEEGFVVKIRLNMDDHNEDDLYKLVDYLYQRYSKYKELFVYSHLLFEDSTEHQKSRSTIERQMMQQKYLIFNAYLRQKYPVKSRGVKYLLQFTQCQADDNGSTIILPDGHLGKCEHYSDTDFWGSIYSDEVDEDVLNDFRRIRYLGEQCNKCFLFPACISLMRCPQTTDHCDEYDMKDKEEFISLCMRNSYDDYKKRICKG